MPRHMKGKAGRGKKEGREGETDGGKNRKKGRKKLAG